MLESSSREKDQFKISSIIINIDLIVLKHSADDRFGRNPGELNL